MNRTFAFGMALLVCLASIASGAVAYEFRQTYRNDRQGGKAVESEGKGLIDGDRSRIEFTRGNVYPPGAFIISTRGASNVILANPETKSYSEMNLAALAARITAGEIEIRNIRTEVEQLPDHPSVSGFPTDHYRTETTYEITIRGSAIALTQNVHTVVEKWTTSAFGDVAGAFVDLDAFRTGNKEIDQILETELAKVKGLPLRTVTTVTTTGAGNLARSAPKRVQVSEMLLSNVRIEAAPATAFAVPAGYTKAAGHDSQQSRVHMLSMEPEKP